MIKRDRGCGHDAGITQSCRHRKNCRPSGYSAAIAPPHRWQLSAFLGGMLLMSIAIGCGSRRGLFIEGVWTDKDRPTARFHFRPDGTGRLTDDCSPINIDVGSGVDFTWKRVGADVKVSFRAARRDYLAKLQNKTLTLFPTDSMRYNDGHFLSNPRTLTWFENKR